MIAPLNVFCCYARKDQELLEQLKTHLVPLQLEGLITIWSDQDLNGGIEWEKELHARLKNADIILLLISPDFMNSDYSYSTEMQRALIRHDKNEAVVIPIILRPVSWQGAPFSKIQVLPTNAESVTSKKWHDRDEAFLDITKSIRKIVKELIGKSSHDRDIPAITHSPTQPKRRRPLVVVVGLLLLSLLVLVGTNISKWLPPSVPKPTQTNSSQPYPPEFSGLGHGNFDFLDPLSQPQPGHWQIQRNKDGNGSCLFSGGALHATELNTGQTFHCYGPPLLSNFAFEVQMTIIQGDCGGISFREDTLTHSFYQFDVCSKLAGSQYDLFKVNENDYKKPSLSYGDVPDSISGLNTTILLAVVVQGSTINLFINHQPIPSVHDSSYTQGSLDLTARDDDSSKTEVVYKNATVWTF